MQVRNTIEQIHIHDTCVPTLHVVPLLTVDFWEGNSVGKKRDLGHLHEFPLNQLAQASG